MSDAEAVATATEAAIGEQCNTVAKTSSHDSTCRRQHFRKSRPTRRTLVTDNDDVATLDLFVLQPSEHRLFVVIHLGRSLFGGTSKIIKIMNGWFEMQSAEEQS